MWRMFRQRVCNVLNVIKVLRRVQGFDRIIVSIVFTMLSQFNESGRAVNGLILLACNLMVFRMA